MKTTYYFIASALFAIGAVLVLIASFSKPKKKHFETRYKIVIKGGVDNDPLIGPIIGCVTCNDPNLYAFQTERGGTLYVQKDMVLAIQPYLVETTYKKHQ